MNYLLEILVFELSNVCLYVVSFLTNNISLNKQFSKDNDSLNKSYKSYTPN